MDELYKGQDAFEDWMQREIDRGVEGSFVIPEIVIYNDEHVVEKFLEMLKRKSEIHNVPLDMWCEWSLAGDTAVIYWKPNYRELKADGR